MKNYRFSNLCKMSTLDKLSAQIEVRILEFNAIVAIIRSKRFKELPHDQHTIRFEVYETRQFELMNQIELLKASSPERNIPIWDGVLKK